jgi:DNA repair protein RecO (recombination protein O)
MPTKKRIQNQSAWILHHRPFSNSSMILEIITFKHGRISLIAKGSRSAKSKFRGLLRPFMPLNISWFARTNLGTLTEAEIQDAPISLAGDALISGYYMNELLLKLLHKDDPQLDVFSLYSETIKKLSLTNQIAPLLRQFEIKLLELIGYALNLIEVVDSQIAINSSSYYEYKPDMGLFMVENKQGAMTFLGSQLQSIQKQNFECEDTLRCANRLLKNIISYQLGGKKLMTRKVIEEMKRNGK